MSHNRNMKQTIRHPNQTRLHYNKALLILMICPQSQVRVSIQTILMLMGNNSRALQVHLLNQLMNLQLVHFIFVFSVTWNRFMNLWLLPVTFLLKKTQVGETNVAELVAYDEQQKALKEQDSSSNMNSHIGRVEHQEQNTESKVSMVLCFLYSFSFM